MHICSSWSSPLASVSQTDRQTHRQTDRQMGRLTDARKRAHTHARARARARAHTHTHAGADTRTRTYAHMHTRPHIRKRTRTHTHARDPLPAARRGAAYSSAPPLSESPAAGYRPERRTRRPIIAAFGSKAIACVDGSRAWCSVHEPRHRLPRTAGRWGSGLDNRHEH